MWSLTGQIKIDDIDIPFSSCSIKTSYDHDTDTATVILPFQDLDLSEERNIEISLGYKKYGLNLEFSGVITEVSSSAPIELTCHSHLHTLRKIRINKRFSKKKISDILKFALKNISPKVAIKVEPDRKINYGCYWKTARWLISDLSQKYKYIPTYNSQTLELKRAYSKKTSTSLPVYEDQVNIIKNSAKNQISRGVGRVVVYSESDKGTRFRGAFGRNKKDEKQIIIEGLNSSKDCYDQAKDIYKYLNSEGLKGEIETFGYPYIRKLVSLPYSNQFNLKQKGCILLIIWRRPLEQTALDELLLLVKNLIKLYQREQKQFYE